MKQDNLTALCTGASGSIGYEICATLLQSYENIAVHGVFRSRNNNITSLEANKKFKPIKMDFLYLDENMLPEDVDILVNCAGLPSGKERFSSVKREEYEEVLDINLHTPIRLTKRYLSGMEKRKFGRIVFVNSIWGLRGSESNAAYTISKHGLSGLMKTIAKESAAFGVTSNEVCPGPVHSDLMSRIASRISGERKINPEVFLSQIEAQLPRGRMVSTKEVAEAVNFLCSDAASGINGVSLVVDGGQIC